MRIIPNRTAFRKPPAFFIKESGCMVCHNNEVILDFTLEFEVNI